MNIRSDECKTNEISFSDTGYWFAYVIGPICMGILSCLIAVLILKNPNTLSGYTLISIAISVTLWTGIWFKITQAKKFIIDENEKCIFRLKDKTYNMLRVGTYTLKEIGKNSEYARLKLLEEYLVADFQVTTRDHYDTFLGVELIFEPPASTAPKELLNTQIEQYIKNNDRVTIGTGKDCMNHLKRATEIVLSRYLKDELNVGKYISDQIKTEIINEKSVNLFDYLESGELSNKNYEIFEKNYNFLHDPMITLPQMMLLYGWNFLNVRLKIILINLNMEEQINSIFAPIEKTPQISKAGIPVHNITDEHLDKLKSLLHREQIKTIFDYDRIVDTWFKKIRLEIKPETETAILEKSTEDEKIEQKSKPQKRETSDKCDWKIF